MLDRLLLHGRSLWLFVVFFNPFALAAQFQQTTTFFNFNFPGPSEIAVDGDCQGYLVQMTTPIVTSTMGFPITQSYFDSVTTSTTFGAPVGIYTPWFPDDVVEVFWQVVDNQGHSFNFQFQIGFSDLTAPYFTGLPADDTLFLASVDDLPPVPNVTALDNCTGVITPLFTQNAPPARCDAGTVTRTWFAMDALNNSNKFVQKIIISADTVGPVISAFPQNGTGDCQNAQVLYQNWLNFQKNSLVATDIHGVQSVACAAPALIGGSCGSTATAVFTVTDSCMNATTASAIFTITDSIAPIFVNAPSNLVLNCAGAADQTNLGAWIATKAGATATDICKLPTFSMKIGGVAVDSAAVQAAFLASQINSCGDRLVGLVVFQNIKAFVEVEFVASDGCNLTTQTATFATQDVTAPIFTALPMDSTESCSNPATLTFFENSHAMAAAEDECGAIIWSNITTLNSPCGGYNIYTVEFLASDACGNGVSASANLNLIDNLGPVITSAQDTILENCGGGDDLTNLQNFIENKGNLTLSDNCSQGDWSPSFRWTTSTGVTGTGNYGVGPYPVIAIGNLCSWGVDVRFRAEDACGNTSADTLYFKITDQTPPVFTTVFATDTFSCEIPPPTNAVAPSVIDNCDASPLLGFVTTFEPLNCGGSYQIVRVWTAVDNCGNKSTATEVFVFIDTIAPVFDLVPPAISVSCGQAIPTAVAGVDFRATDDCTQNLASLNSVDNSNQNPNLADCGHYNYTITRVFTAIDSCGNAATASQIITVSDTTGPVFTQNLTFSTTCDNITNYPAPTAVDACGGLSTVVSTTPEIIVTNGCADNYTLQRHFSATDICGNVTDFTQNITVVDTVKPILFGVPGFLQVTCGNVPTAPIIGTQITGTDNCDPSVAIIFSESTTQIASPADCGHYNYWITREWLAVDNCLNSRQYAQTIQVEDKDAPAMVLGANVLIPNAQNQCSADVFFDHPATLRDTCTSSIVSALVGDNQPIQNTSGLPDNSTPVDEIVLNIALNNVFPDQPMVGNGTLDFTIDNFDGEELTEFFDIFGEQNTFLGTTLPASGQCGSLSMSLVLTENQLNNWGQDGFISIKLVPASDSTDAVNMLCPNGTVDAILDYQYVQPKMPVTLIYSIDGGLPQSFPPAGSTNLAVGMHILTLTASDCSGNSVSASQNINVVDVFPPTMNVLANQNLFASDTCLTRFNLPFPQNLTDNCGFSSNFDQNLPAQPLIFQNNPNVGLSPKNIVLTFTGVVPNAISGGELSIPLLADNGDLGEFFQVFDENNVQIGQTIGGGTNQCLAATTTNFNLTTAQINQWAADGTVTFTLKANDDAAVWTDFISPCDTLLPDNSDGLSSVGGRLRFGFASVFYEIKTTSGSVVKSGQVIGNQSVTIVPSGQFEVEYSVTDRNGLVGKTAFQLVVRDTSRPTAVCAGSQIYVNPSGLVSHVIAAQTLNGGSVDNCTSALAFSVSPSVIDCSAIGSSVAVVLTVTDESGNSASCPTLISVNGESPQPAFLGNVCQNDTLQLFANAPVAPGNVVYNYLWTAPNGSQFTTENPVIATADLSYEGTWFLEISGLSGCQSTGLVQVNLTNTPAQPTLSTTAPSFCDGDNLILQTQAYSGQNPTFLWYAGQFPGGTLLGTTITPQFLVPNAPAGNYDYYAMVNENGCLSQPSAGLAVAVFAHPSVAILSPGITVCEGENVSLSTPTSGATVAYNWTGPNGFSSNLQFPTAILAAIPGVHSGNYQLIISENGCPAPAANLFLQVKNRPATPELGTDLPKCAGQTVQLVSNVTNAQTYIWYPPTYPTEDADTTTVNNLTILNAQPAVSGSWRVQIFAQGCPSDTSTAKQVLVKNYPSLAAANNGPLCAGSPVQFSATTNQIAGSNFRWEGPGGFLNFSQNPTLTVPVSDIYLVTVTNDIGCSTTGQTTVIISPKPVVAAIVTDAPICENSAQNIGLQALVSPPDPSYVYNWKGPNGWTSSDQSPVLNGATAVWNGSYSLTISKSLGQNICESNPKSVNIAIVATPKTPTISSVAALCAGNNFSLFVQNAGDYPANATYIWTTPIGTQTTNSPSLVITNANVGYNGNYTVEVAVNGCKSGLSAISNVVVHLVPTPPSVTTNSPVCEGDQIVFSTPLNNLSTYSWFGPNGWTASVYNPVRANAQVSFSGPYFIKISQNGCESSLSEPINVVVKPRAAVPALSGVSQICLDAPAATLMLAINSTSQTPAATYNWYEYFNPQSSVLLTSSGSSAGLNFTNLNQFSAGNHQFSVVADLNGCSSLPSLPFTVSMFDIPQNQAFAGADKMGCTGNDFQLEAQTPSIGSGKWTQIGGLPLNISNPDAATTPVSGNPSMGIYQFSWTLSNGACLNYARDSVQISVQNFEQANAGSGVDICFSTFANLSALPSQNGNGFWSQPTIQSLLGVQIGNSNNPNTAISGLTPGSIYTFSWNIPDQGCGATTDEVLVRVLNSEAFAGQDRVECGQNGCITAAAAAPGQFEMGEWSSPDPNISFANPTTAVTDACGLISGQNVLIWTLNQGVCGVHSVDTVLLNFEPEPTALADSVAIDFGNNQRFDVVLNDILPNSWNISTNNLPANGRLDDLGNGVFEYQPNIGFKGADKFQYTICNAACPNACQSAEVVLTINGAPDCDPPTIITPNNDGVNDIFVIACFKGDGTEDNEVAIFNEWGDEVFHAKPYRNNWNGEYSGQPLPPGTYFYVIKMNGNAPTVKGFLVIQR